MKHLPASELPAAPREGGVAAQDEVASTATVPTGSWARRAIDCPVDVATSRGEALPEGRFEIRRQLGSGGFGTVHLAWDKLLLREVAIKRPRSRLNPSAEQNFLHEARAAARI